MLCLPTMHLERPLLIGLVCAAALIAPAVAAQPQSPPEPPETLETPYEEPPPVAAPATPDASPPAPIAATTPFARAPPPVSARADTRPLRPIRAIRKLALMGEIGWNGLAGFGPVLTYHAHPHVALDLGAGLSLMGGKVGVRARYNFLTAPLTPFVGLGYVYAAGFSQQNFDLSSDSHGDPNRDPVTLELKPSQILQGVFGFDLVREHGFTMLGCVGYSRVLNHHTVNILAGKLTNEEQNGVKILFKSGPVISLAAGYAFE